MTEMMDVKLWTGGLTLHEVNAIECIQKVFCAGCGKDKPSQPSRGLSLREQMAQATGRSSSRMWPWKGYAGFRFFDSRGYEGEFDLVLITHCLVLIVELKHWNGELTSCDGNWYLNGHEMGRSPVAVCQKKQFLLKNKLDKYGGRFSSLKGNKFSSPKVEFRVVLTGKAIPDQLPEADRYKTMSFDDFLSLADERKFTEIFHPHPASYGINSDIPLFDEIFSEKQTRPKHLIINGYMAVEKIFPLNDEEHAYKEFRAVSVANNSDEALLRQWNFSNILDSAAKTPEGRFKIVSREQDVLSFIKNHDYDLYQHCLRSLKTITPQEVSLQFHELYELPAGHSRFNEFAGRHLESITEEGRIALVKILINFFSNLHKIKVAHRDIGDHSLWVSPAKQVAVSSFVSAYHQPIGTVGKPRQSLSVGTIPLPVKNIDRGRLDTPYSEDVYYLGIMAWLILRAKRLSTRSLIEIKEDLSTHHTWYAPIISKALEVNSDDRYPDAGSFLDAFNRGLPKTQPIKLFDESDLELYRKTIRLHKEYPEESFLLEGEIKEVYRSGDCIVKLWNDVSPSENTPDLSVNVIHFLKHVEKLRSIQPEYLPTIRDFGLATRTSQLFLIQDHVKGRSWQKVSGESKRTGIAHRISMAIKLIDAVQHLHDINSYHGDIHPENILVVNRESEHKIFLIDVPDFDILSGITRNHRYSPESIDASSPQERDNYGAMRLCAELLGIDWNDPVSRDEQISKIAEVIALEKSSQFGFSTLTRFRDALLASYEGNPLEKIVTVGLRGFGNQDSLSILPDNGKVYVSLAIYNKHPGMVRVTISGVGGQLVTIYNPEKNIVEFCYPPTRESDIYLRFRERADFHIQARINIKSEASDRFEELNNILYSQDVFFTRMREIQDESKKIGQAGPNIGVSPHGKPIRTLLKEPPVLSEQTKGTRSILTLPKKLPCTTDIWKAIITTEEEALPRIEVSDDPRLTRDSSELVVPFLSKGEVLEAYERDDQVELIRLNGETTTTIGRVNIGRSSPSLLRVEIRQGSYARITAGETLYLRTTQDRSSFLRRKTALSRIIERRGVVKELIDYFDPNCSIEPKKLADAATEADFAAYDRTDEQGTTISLNQEQRDAFNKLLTKGPISLLQGPPGTGKTEFIAAFVHYLVAKAGVQNILLVSQSHEAINNAAERIRRHCRRLNTPLDVVRFSNSEGAVSEELLDIYSRNIVLEKLTLFEADYDQRVLALHSALGVSKDYLVQVLDAEREISRRVVQLDRLNKDFQSDDFSKEEKYGIESAKKDIILQLNLILRSKYGVEPPDDLAFDKILGEVFRKISYEFGIAPHEERRVLTLIKIGQDFKEKLATERVNFDEFLGRSRTLVCGTCVGVGQPHIGIKDNQYDWVIIDEAARSSASELAVAMQSGKRILLVGDHQQLPPLYQEEHKEAVARELGLTSRDQSHSNIFFSDFERCFKSEYGSQVGATLQTQYRMIKPIGDLVSEVFYQGKLKTALRDSPDCFLNPPQILSNAVTWIDTASLGIDGEHSDDAGPSIYNTSEINIAVSVLKSIQANNEFCNLLSNILKEGEAGIGVICMYGEQKRRLRRRFHELEWTEEFKKLVKIDTVDSYQGKEIRVVILSLTRNRLKDGPGFLREPNRINVSMSRAMDRLLIVGSTEMWTLANEGKPLSKVCEFMKSNNSDYAFLPAEKLL